MRQWVALMQGRKLEWCIAALLFATAVIVCVRYGGIFYGDYPDHLARAVVISDLLFHGGEHFGATFQFHAMPIPYLLGDLLLVALVETLGVHGATVVWTALTLLALPLAVHFLLHVTKAPRNTRALFLIVSLYCSLDWFFIAGFLNFRLAVAMVIVAFALAQSLRSAWSWRMFVLYVITVVFGYLMHLSFIVFLATAIGATTPWRLWGRTTTLSREASLIAPVLCMLVWHVIHVRVLPETAEVVRAHLDWGSPGLKFKRIDWGFVRRNAPLDWLIVLGFAACPLIAAARVPKPGEWFAPAVVDTFFLTTAFVLLYLALPMRAGDITYIDVRALALATPMAIFAALALSAPDLALHGRRRRAACVGLAVLATGNLISLGWDWAGSDAWMTEYRALTQTVPSDANVLPVYTYAVKDRWRPYLHAAALAVVIDRHAMVSNLFSGDRGQPMKYFRYLHHRYEPPVNWYVERAPGQVDWRAVACDYDFMLITAPYEPHLIRVGSTVAARNSSGALLKVDRRDCHPAAQ